MTTSFPAVPGLSTFVPDSPAAWRRLLLALAIGAVGSIGMWSVVVALPKVQAEFGGSRGAASLAFTLAMLGFGIGGVVTGRLADRFGIVAAIGMGILSLLCGYLAAGVSTALWQFTLVHFFIGLGSSATFAPLMAEASHWFVRRRGIAVTIAASGNYVGGAIWPTLIERGMVQYGWQMTHIAIGIFCAVVMTLLVLILRSDMRGSQRRSSDAEMRPSVDLKISANALTVILSLASFSCCVAMAMPQVHIVAYCGDLGYGVARGAEMLALMLAFGIVSRIGSGFIADRLGGLGYIADRISGARPGARDVSVLRRPDVALCRLRIVRPVPGRTGAELCDHRSRDDAGEGSRDPRRHRDHGIGGRHVVRRMDLRRDFRHDGLVPGGISERSGMERAEHRNRADAAVALAPPPRVCLKPDRFARPLVEAGGVREPRHP